MHREKDAWGKEMTHEDWQKERKPGENGKKSAGGSEKGKEVPSA